MKLKVTILMLAGLLLGAGAAEAQRFRDFASNVIIPQRRVVQIRQAEAVRITEVKANVEIENQLAVTELQIHVQNPGSRRLEAELLVPVPEGAVIRGFTFAGGGPEGTAELLPRDEARRIYDGIVNQSKDPALLEFVGYNLARSSVFPVEPGGEQWVRLTYENLLRADGDRVDFVIPRSESLEYDVPWKINVEIESKDALSTIYSPSHDLRVERQDKHTAKLHLREPDYLTPGAFRLSYLLERDGVSASLMAYPDPKMGGGYFLLLAGLPSEALAKGDRKPMKREVTIVFDRSGSMNGEKLEQVREAALQVISGLDDGEFFNIMVYNEAVDVFSDEPVVVNRENLRAAREYLNSVRARGGTNIHDALVEALRQRPTGDSLPIVLFLTDGLPTIGDTSETGIRAAVEKGNPHRRRVFTFGVGVDVNTPLLNAVATQTRATSTFVLPKEDVEVKVAAVFERLVGPVLAYPELKTERRRTHDLVPNELPDLFAGDELVVLGQYVGDAPLSFTLTGNYFGEAGRFDFEFNLDKATTRNAYVPRLWASRKIGVLLEAIRDMGGNGTPGHTPGQDDPKMKELIDEVVRLSTEFGILTEYTAFLARDGQQMTQSRAVEEAERIVFFRNSTRSGNAGLNQESNINYLKGQKSLNFKNGNISMNLEQDSLSIVPTQPAPAGQVAGVRDGFGGGGLTPNRGASVSRLFTVESESRQELSKAIAAKKARVGVQQVNDLAFYWKGEQWIDSRIVDKPQEQQKIKTIEFGTQEFMDLVRRLIELNRQGSVSLRGDVLMLVDGDVVLVKAPKD